MRRCVTFHRVTRGVYPDLVVHQLERVTNLLTLLLTTRQHLSFEDVRHALRGQYPENLAAARAAFERDKAILREEGVPIDQVVLGGDRAGATGYRIIRSEYEVKDFGLDPDEALALRVAVGTIRMGTSWSQEALWKVDLESHLYADSVVGVELPVDERLPVIHGAIAESRPLKYRYHDKDRTLHPYGLLARQGWWYVIGHDTGVDQLRTYRVDRIQGGVTSGEPASFERPVGFDVRTAFPADPKLLPDSVDVGSDVAEVRVDPRDIGAVVRDHGEDCIVRTDPDGWVVVGVPCSNVRAFMIWLFGFLERAEVIGPPELRRMVVDWLSEAAREGRP